MARQKGPERAAAMAQARASGRTLREIAEEYGISKQRVLQILTPIESAAREAVASALSSGRLQRPAACSGCATPCQPEAHHHDYTRPLDVVWLCTLCHGQAHTPDAPTPTSDGGMTAYAAALGARGGRARALRATQAGGFASRPKYPSDAKPRSRQAPGRVAKLLQLSTDHAARLVALAREAGTTQAAIVELGIDLVGWKRATKGAKS